MDLDKVLIGEDGTVPRARYTSAEFAELEFERLWSRVWQVACREEEIAEVGAFIEYLIGDQSILVVRSDPDTIQAFHNTCLHRGTRLADGTGCFPDACIRCRYHAWRYDLDGRLVEVVDEDEFDPIPPDTGLKAVQVDRWGGFVWICLDPGAPPLLEYLDPLPTLLAPYHLDRLRIRTYLSTVLPANWKVAVDAFNEGYHVQGTHPQLLPVDRRRQPRVRAARPPRPLRAPARTPGANCVPVPVSGLTEGDYDEGEILENFVRGLGGLFYRDESALVEEIRATPRDGETMLSRYQKGRRDAPGRPWRGGRRVHRRPTDQRGRRLLLPQHGGADLPGHRHRLPRPAQRHPIPTAASRTRGSCSGRQTTSPSSEPNAASSQTGPSATGVRSPTRTTPTWNTSRSG